MENKIEPQIGELYIFVKFRSVKFDPQWTILVEGTYPNCPTVDIGDYAFFLQKCNQKDNLDESSGYWQILTKFGIVTENHEAISSLLEEGCLEKSQ